MPWVPCLGGGAVPSSIGNRHVLGRSTSHFPLPMSTDPKGSRIYLKKFLECLLGDHFHGEDVGPSKRFSHFKCMFGSGSWESAVFCMCSDSVAIRGFPVSLSQCSNDMGKGLWFYKTCPNSPQF